jgi:hypothetical protein
MTQSWLSTPYKTILAETDKRCWVPSKKMNKVLTCWEGLETGFRQVALWGCGITQWLPPTETSQQAQDWKQTLKSQGARNFPIASTGVAEACYGALNLSVPLCCRVDSPTFLEMRSEGGLAPKRLKEQVDPRCCCSCPNSQNQLTTQERQVHTKEGLKPGRIGSEEALDLGGLRSHGPKERVKHTLCNL